jgi:DNA-binding XRE family transcriptional regulator
MAGRPGDETKLEGRNGEIWRWISLRGKTQAWCAEHYGISQQRVAQIEKDVRDSIPPIDRAELIQESIELIKYVKDQAVAMVEMAGAPVAVGKDGSILYDPETGAVVRDYAARDRALATALKADDTLAKRLGLDAATKTETTATVRYSIEGVAPEDLA